MNVEEYLNLVAYKGQMLFPSGMQTVYLSNFDDSYITMEGIEPDFPLTALAELEVTEKLEHGVGFSPKHNKWYGWSHRGIAGFTIGSTCEPGHCHYRTASDKEELEDSIRFWTDPNKKYVRGKILRPGLIEVSYEYRSVIETTLKYWFNYDAFSFREKVKMFLDWSFIPWFTDSSFNSMRIREILLMLKRDFLEGKRTAKILNEYDPNNFGKGSWTAETMEDARQMAIDYCEGIS